MASTGTDFVQYWRAGESLSESEQCVLIELLCSPGILFSFSFRCFFLVNSAKALFLSNKSGFENVYFQPDAACTNAAVYFPWNHHIDPCCFIVPGVCMHTHAHSCVCAEAICEGGSWELRSCVFSRITDHQWMLREPVNLQVLSCWMFWMQVLLNLQFNKTQMTPSLFL